MTSSRYVRVSDGEEANLELLPIPFTTTTYEDLYPKDSDEERPDSPTKDVPSELVSATPVSQEADFNTHLDSDTTGRPTLTRPILSPLQPDGDTVVGSLEPMRIDEAARRLSLEDRVKYAISPQTHHPRYPSEKMSLLSSAKSEKDTTRIYGYWRQSRRMWRLATSEWLATAALCGAFAGVLKYYSRLDILLPHQISTFNSMTTFITFLLGVNLTGSMRSYAKLLRWLLLSICWQPLETFDLMLRCESLINVCKIAWKARTHQNLRLRWTTRLLCGLWLASNLALMLFVGMIGLTYNTEPSAASVNVKPGPMQITDFNRGLNDPAASLNEIQESGESAVRYDMSPGFDYGLDSSIQTELDGVAHYWFLAWSPDDPSIEMRARVTITSVASCSALDVIAGGDGSSTEITYLDVDGSSKNWTIAPDEQNLPYSGGFVAVSEYCQEECGSERTTNVTLFVAGTDDDPTATVFTCTNTLSLTYWADPKNSSALSSSTLTVAPDEYQLNDNLARMLAGAIGWNGDYAYDTTNNSVWQGQAYQIITDPGYFLQAWYGPAPTTQNISDFIASFTIKSIYGLDQRPAGINLFKTVSGQVPTQAQKLSVNWKNAILLLAGIPSLQLAALMMVFAVANKAIIKDDSPLAMAKLYWNLLNKYDFGSRGCMLKGHEIVEMIGERTGTGHHGPLVKYGWKDSGRKDEQWRTIGHLDVFERSDEGLRASVDSGSFHAQDQGRVKDVFWGGIKYDGMSAGFEARSGKASRRRAKSLSDAIGHDRRL